MLTHVRCSKLAAARQCQCPGVFPIRFQGYDVYEDMLGPKTAAANFISTLAQKKPKSHLPSLMARLVEVMNAHAAAVKAGNVPMELARQMDGAMLAIGSLNNTLKTRVRNEEHWVSHTAGSGIRLHAGLSQVDRVKP